MRRPRPTLQAGVRPKPNRERWPWPARMHADVRSWACAADRSPWRHASAKADAPGWRASVAQPGTPALAGADGGGREVAGMCGGPGHVASCVGQGRRSRRAYVRSPTGNAGLGRRGWTWECGRGHVPRTGARGVTRRPRPTLQAGVRRKPNRECRPWPVRMEAGASLRDFLRPKRHRPDRKAGAMGHVRSGSNRRRLSDAAAATGRAARTPRDRPRRAAGRRRHHRC
jgi:hypothetical protein